MARPDSVLDPLLTADTPPSAREVFADLGGGKNPAPKARTVKPDAQLATAVSMPFDLAAMIASVMNEPELAGVLPLTEPERRALSDAVMTHVQGNPMLLALLERGSGGLSMAHLIVVLLTVLQPRAAAIQAVIAARLQEKRNHDATAYLRTAAAQPVPESDGGGRAPENPAAVPSAGGSAGDAGEQPQPDGFSRAELRAHAHG